MEPLFEKLKQEGITTPQRLVLPKVQKSAT